MTDATTSPRKRSWPRILIAAALGISGLSAILYAGFLPLVPFTNVPVPVVWQAFGAAEVVAAVGVWLGRTWGRRLGVAVVMLTMVLSTARVVVANAGPSAILDVGAFLVGIAVDALILWWLLRRWESGP